MRLDELYKFSDGTLTRILSLLDDITKNIDIEYLPKRRWCTLEKKKAHCIIKDINKLLKERRMMRSLEKFVGVSQGQAEANATCSYSTDIYKDIMKAQKSQDHKMGILHDDVKRLCLVDDLKKLKYHIHMTTTVVNNSLFRSLFEKQKLTGNNFMEWYRNLRIMLSTKDKLPFLKQPIPTLPVLPAAEANPSDVKNQKKKSHKAAKGNQGKGKAKMGYAPVQALPFDPKPKNPLTPKKDKHAKDTICHQCGEDDIYEIVLSNTNDSFMYVVSNKRAKVNLDSALLWHCRLGHINKKYIKKLQHDGLLDSTDINSFEKCVSYMSEKMARKPYSNQVEWAKDLLGLIHTNICGPFKIISRQGAYYFVTFTDDFSRYGYVYLLKHKHEVFETFKAFQKKVENQLGKTIRSLRFDYGERRNRTLLDMVRSMMSQTALPKSFWDYVLESATHILNMVPTKKVDKTPYEVWHGIPKGNDWILFLLPTQEQSLCCPECYVIDHEESRSLEDLEIIQEEDTHPSIDTSLNHKEDDQDIDEPQSDINHIRRSTRTRRALYHMCLYINAEEHELGDLGEPANYKVVLLDPESDKWLNSINVEMQSMKDNEVWELVDLPLDEKTIGHKWLLKRKTGMDGAVHTYKAHLNPCDAHWTAVKNILWCLRNTKDMFLVYGGDMKRELRVSCYTDVGYLTDVDDMNSQTGYVFILNGEAVWIHKFISRLGVVPINMYCDITGAISIAKDHGVTKGAKHFRVKVHYLRETIEIGDVKIEKVDTYDNLADPLQRL
uniref:GAG-pre-integrase domain-containing protein n=1 Tax=Tanacetum cinerariifolium TaxID=118510 RepID=A0A699GNG0_TANCI|nr:hypothetical protein [Tanacetum cinerariifolium]